MVWSTFSSSEPELAQFVVDRLRNPPAYLATIRRGGRPRVPPVTPIVTDDSLFVFMEATSPELADLIARRHFALHTRVDDTAGTGGEALLTGTAESATDLALRSHVADRAPYDPPDRYELVELLPTEVKVSGYSDIALPSPQSWTLISDERISQC